MRLKFLGNCNGKLVAEIDKIEQYLLIDYQAFSDDSLEPFFFSPSKK